MKDPFIYGEAKAYVVTDDPHEADGVMLIDDEPRLAAELGVVTDLYWNPRPNGSESSEGSS